MRSGFLQFGRYQSHPALSLGKAEAAFNFYSFAFILMGLSFVLFRILLRPAKGWSGQSDMMFLAVRQIRPGPIDFVRQNTLGIMSFPRMESFGDFLQCSRSGKRPTLLPVPPLRTVRESFPSHGSSLS